MEKYIIRCNTHHANYILHTVKVLTDHWSNPPKIRKAERTIDFGETFILLATDDKQMKGRHDWGELTEDGLLYAIDIFNENIAIKLPKF